MCNFLCIQLQLLYSIAFPVLSNCIPLIKFDLLPVKVLGSALSYNWPTFPYLTTLTLQLNVCLGWTCFSKVLQSAPRLVVLILNLFREGIGGGNSYEWAPPNDIPSCLLEHLVVVGFKWFKGNKDELRVVEYLLNNAQVLEHMMIEFHPDPIDEEVVEKLLMFPRASKTCDIQVSG